MGLGTHDFPTINHVNEVGLNTHNPVYDDRKVGLVTHVLTGRSIRVKDSECNASCNCKVGLDTHVLTIAMSQKIMYN